MTLKEYLFTPCPNEDLIPDENGSLYMPISEVKARIAFIEGNWGVYLVQRNFRHQYYTMAGKPIISGSIEVVLGDYQLVGAANFVVGKFGANDHHAATLRSLCVTNALRWKFPAFGSHLEGNEVEVVDNVVGGNAPTPPPKPEEAAVEKRLLLLIGNQTTLEKLAAFKEEASKSPTTLKAYMDKVKELTLKSPTND